jgi:hypothetical protein
MAYFLAIGKLLSKDQPKKQKSETVSRKSEVDGNASQVDQRWIKLTGDSLNPLYATNFSTTNN